MPVPTAAAQKRGFPAVCLATSTVMVAARAADPSATITSPIAAAASLAKGTLDGDAHGVICPDAGFLVTESTPATSKPPRIAAPARGARATIRFGARSTASRSRARGLGGGRNIREGRRSWSADVRRAGLRGRAGRERLPRRRGVPRRGRAPAPVRSVSSRRGPTRRRADRAQGGRLRRPDQVDRRGWTLGRRSPADVATSRLRRDRGEPGVLGGRAGPAAGDARATRTTRAAAAAPDASPPVVVPTAGARTAATRARAGRRPPGV